MCGISAYAGREPALPFILQALRKLEYRGYDSWGFGLRYYDGAMQSHRVLGRVTEHPSRFGGFDAHLGIGHTRWATHGKASLLNTHPIEGGWLEKNVLVVHNGVIDNYEQVRRRLEGVGYRFQTETDTEVIAHLLDQLLSHYIPEKAVDMAMLQLVGKYAFVAIHRQLPGLLIAVNGSPLVFAKGGYVASDPAALAGFGDGNYYRLQDGQSAYFPQSNDYPNIWQQGRVVYRPSPKKITISTTELGGFPDFMTKEIHEQPTLLRVPYIDADELDSKPKQVVLLGCGSSYNACLLSRNQLERILNVAVTVEYASEFSHRDLSHYPPGTAFMAVTQSGETKDTLLAMEHVNDYPEHHLNLWAVTNNADSTAAALVARNRLFLEVGSERSVAATKTFTLTYTSLVQLAQSLCGETPIVFADAADKMSDFLSNSHSVVELAKKVATYRNVLFLGRGHNYALAREGALKLKEVAYIHAEALPAAEMKHGPLSLIDDSTLCIFIITSDGFEQEKVLTNMREVKARAGVVVAITDDVMFSKVVGIADHIISHRYLPVIGQPVLTAVVLQLLAYHTAVYLHREVDYPRNISKTCTTE